jgi:hypothetical protein
MTSDKVWPIFLLTRHGRAPRLFFAKIRIFGFFNLLSEVITDGA